MIAWCIKGSPEFQKFLAETPEIKNKNTVGGNVAVYYSYSGIDEIRVFGDKPTPGYTEVTIDTLKQWYKKKKVTNYQTLKDLPQHPAGSVLYFDSINELWVLNGLGKMPLKYTDHEVRQLPEWFSPIYERPEIKFSGHKLERVSHGKWKFGCTEFDYDILDTLIVKLETVVTQGIKVQSITLANGMTVPVGLLKEIHTHIETYDFDE